MERRLIWGMFEAFPKPWLWSFPNRTKTNSEVVSPTLVRVGSNWVKEWFLHRKPTTSSLPTFFTSWCFGFHPHLLIKTKISLLEGACSLVRGGVGGGQAHKTRPTMEEPGTPRER